MNEWTHPGERIDPLNRDGLSILQRPDLFCFGMDAVLLADYAAIRKKERVLDLCTGTGIVPILMYAREHDASYEGLEIHEEMADMAGRSVRMNEISHAVSIRQGNVKEIRGIYAPREFDVVTANPPYLKGGLLNQNPAVTAARHEILCTFDDVAGAAAYVLKDHGRFVLVHRPMRLKSVMAALKDHRLEPKRMRFVHSREGQEAALVLIETVKYGKEQLKVEAPLFVYGPDGQYTRECLELYGNDV